MNNLNSEVVCVMYTTNNACNLETKENLPFVFMNFFACFRSSINSPLLSHIFCYTLCIELLCRVQAYWQQMRLLNSFQLSKRVRPLLRSTFHLCHNLSRISLHIIHVCHILSRRSVTWYIYITSFPE